MGFPHRIVHDVTLQMLHGAVMVKGAFICLHQVLGFYLFKQMVLNWCLEVITLLI